VILFGDMVTVMTVLFVTVDLLDMNEHIEYQPHNGLIISVAIRKRSWG